MQEHSKTAYDFSTDAAKVVLDVLLAALPVALVYSFFLLLISVVLIIVMHKRRLYTREAKAWNLLTKLHYPLWMLLLVGLGFGLGFIASIQSSCDRAIDEKLRPALVGMVIPFQSKIIDSLPPELADKPMTGQAIYDYVIERTVKLKELERSAEEAEGWLQDISLQIQNAAQRHIVTYAIDTAIKRAGEKAGIAGKDVEFTLETFKAIDFSEEADEIAAKVSSEAKKHVSGFANGMRLQVLIYGGILVLLLLVEPLIFYFIVVPRKRKTLAQAQAMPSPEVE